MARSLRFLITALAAFAASGAQPIRLHPKNPHYFEFRGKAIAIVASGEHYGSVLNRPFDYKKYLDTISAAGLNYTRIFGGSYTEIPARSFGIKRNTLAPEGHSILLPWLRTESGYDLDQWNPDYFTRYRDFLLEASKRGIIVEITLFSSHYQEQHWKISPFHPADNINHTDEIDWKKLHTLDNGNILARQEQYVRKLVREANGFDNVIFEIQNEPWSDRPRLASVVNPYLQGPARDRYPNSIEAADDLSFAWQSRVVEWISTEEGKLPNRHLIAQNYANFGVPIRDLVPGVSMINFHYAYPFAVEANYGLGKAIGYDETGFLGTDDDVYTRQAWNFMLTGGSLFDHLDYSFSLGHEDGSDAEPNGPGGGSPTLRRRLGILSHFLNSLPLAELAPDSRTVRHANGAYARTLSTPSGHYAIYLDGDGPTATTMDLPAGDYRGEWLDIRTGNTSAVPPFHHAGGEKVLPTPPLMQSVALRITRITAR